MKVFARMGQKKSPSKSKAIEKASNARRIWFGTSIA
jgi:hypothetical protein